jgi:hypothetical protein
LKDFDIELAAYLMIDQRKNTGLSTPIPTEVDQLFDWWRGSIRTSGNGCIQLKLDEYLSSAPSVRAILVLIDGAIIHLQKLGDVVSADYQNQVLGANLVYGERKSADIIAVLEKVKGVRAAL